MVSNFRVFLRNTDERLLSAAYLPRLHFGTPITQVNTFHVSFP